MSGPTSGFPTPGPVGGGAVVHWIRFGFVSSYHNKKKDVAASSFPPGSPEPHRWHDVLAPHYRLLHGADGRRPPARALSYFTVDDEAALLLRVGGEQGRDPAYALVGAREHLDPVALFLDGWPGWDRFDRTDPPGAVPVDGLHAAAETRRRESPPGAGDAVEMAVPLVRAMLAEPGGAISVLGVADRDVLPVLRSLRAVTEPALGPTPGFRFTFSTYAETDDRREHTPAVLFLPELPHVAEPAHRRVFVAEPLDPDDPGTHLARGLVREYRQDPAGYPRWVAGAVGVVDDPAERIARLRDRLRPVPGYAPAAALRAWHRTPARPGGVVVHPLGPVDPPATGFGPRRPAGGDDPPTEVIDLAAFAEGTIVDPAADHGPAPSARDLGVSPGRPGDPAGRGTPDEPPDGTGTRPPAPPEALLGLLDDLCSPDRIDGALAAIGRRDAPPTRRDRQALRRHRPALRGAVTALAGLPDTGEQAAALRTVLEFGFGPGGRDLASRAVLDSFCGWFVDAVSDPALLAVGLDLAARNGQRDRFLVHVGLQAVGQGTRPVAVDPAPDVARGRSPSAVAARVRVLVLVHAGLIGVAALTGLVCLLIGVLLGALA